VSSTTPDLAWQGVERVGVQCLVAWSPLADREALSRTLCERVRRLAAEKAPLPVQTMNHGDPALIAAGTAAILVHASVQPAPVAGGAPILVFSMRPYRYAVPNEVIFGAAPRATSLPASGAADAALDAALAAALSETLPWMAPPQGRARSL
jgi:hypothetical protein